jgi:hypothetical protein
MILTFYAARSGRSYLSHFMAPHGFKYSCLPFRSESRYRDTDFLNFAEKSQVKRNLSPKRRGSASSHGTGMYCMLSSAH